MKIKINGVEEDIHYQGNVLGGLLDEIKKARVLPGTFISKIMLNQQSFEPDSAKARLTLVSQIQSLEVEILSIQEVVGKNLDNAEDYLRKLIPGITRASELFRLESEQEATKFFLSIIDGIDWLTQVLDGILKVLDLDPAAMLINGKTVKDRQSHLIRLTSQLLEANQNRDWILVADLLEYEIAPYYEEWGCVLERLRQIFRESIN